MRIILDAAETIGAVGLGAAVVDLAIGAVSLVVLGLALLVAWAVERFFTPASPGELADEDDEP